MRTAIAIGISTALALAGGCAGGNCPRSGAASRGNAGGEQEASAQGSPQQGPTEHPAPTADLALEAETVRASPSDAPPDHLTPETIQHIVRGQISDVHQCYENGLVAQPALAGRIVLRIHIHATGNVVGAEVGESTLGEGGQTVADCIVEHVDDWHFPEAQHDVAVSYPFVLEPSAPPPS